MLLEPPFHPAIPQQWAQYHHKSIPNLNLGCENPEIEIASGFELIVGILTIVKILP